MDNKTEENKPNEKNTSTENKTSDISSKIPNLSNIAKKINLDGILGSIKSIISPEEGSAMKIDPNDDLGMKVAEISALLQEISKTQTQLSKDFLKVNDLLMGLFKDVEAIRFVKKENVDINHDKN